MNDKSLKEKILTWLERRLESGEDFFLPLNQLHHELRSGLKIPIPPPEEIGAWLQRDERFNFIAIPPDTTTPAEEKKLEELGYYQGPRVGLQSRRPSPAQATKLLRQQAEKMISSLQKAYQARPREGGEEGEIEDRLLELLQQADRIKKEISKFENEEEKTDE